MRFNLVIIATLIAVLISNNAWSYEHVMQLGNYIILFLGSILGIVAVAAYYSYYKGKISSSDKCFIAMLFSMPLICITAFFISG